MSLSLKIKLSLLSLIILSSGLGIFAVYPFFQEIKKNSQQLILERQNLLSLESKIKSLENFGKRVQKLKPDLERIDSLFVELDLPVDFIRFLEKISLDSSVNIKISPSPSVKISGDTWLSSNFQLSLAGSFPRFLKFLGKLENSQYLIESQSLSISRLTDADLGDIKASLSIKVFTR